MARIPGVICAAHAAERGNSQVHSYTAPYANGPSRAGWSLSSVKTVT